MQHLHQMRFAACVVLTAFALFASASEAENPVDRGRYIVEVIGACGNCHSPAGLDGPDTSTNLSGGQRFELPGMHVVTPNLTPDRETGIGAWSDVEIIRAFREGVRPDGVVLGPMMPLSLYRRISDQDAAAIVAYLRSLPPIRHAVERSTYEFPLPESWGPQLGSVPHPDQTDPVAWGAYLAGPLGHCVECHTTPSDDGHPDFENRFGAGGWPFEGPWGISVSSNLTPSGLAHWSDDEVKAMITGGTRPDGRAMLPPMPYGYYAGLTEEDQDALVAYLRSLPPR